MTVPVGSIVAFAGQIEAFNQDEFERTTGWLLCNGRIG
jgi:hypothetical protein